MSALTRIIKTAVLLICMGVIALPAAAEDDAAGTAALLKPVFPDVSSSLIFMEGEDAVSTNFANQPVFNYGCSGLKSLQLNRQTGLQGGGAFYAEYAFYVEREAEYEFWYGGTPPGPADELMPSYASPFSFSINGGEPVEVFREDVRVIEGYTPSCYWVRYGRVRLPAGSHRIRIEVDKKREFDGRYFFYLDSLFFLDPSGPGEPVGNRPAVFPENPESSSIDNPFLSISEYEQYIDANPQKPEGYIELSLVYSLLGDYMNALKMLNRVIAIDPEDHYPVLLSAKNRLWKGDVRESLNLYERAVVLNPDEPALWAEAGKVAAWTADYSRAISFFERGLERFPDDMNLRINLGLTYLWMSRNDDAEKVIAGAEELALADPAVVPELGRVEEANGYSEYARGLYLKAIDRYPEYLEFYLLLQESYLDSGMREESEQAGLRISETFEASPQLDSVLELFRRRVAMRDGVIASYRERLADEPDNLELRQEFAQTLFWNGMRSEATRQIRYVLAAHSFRAAAEYEKRNADLLSLSDRTAVCLYAAGALRVKAESVRKALLKASSVYSAALRQSEAAPEDAGKAAALKAAERGMADLSSEALYLQELYDIFAGHAEAIEAAVGELSVREKTDSEGFSAAVEPSGWLWKPARQKQELRDVYETEPVLASYMLGRIMFAEGDYAGVISLLEPASGDEAAEASAEAAAPTADERTGYLLYQSLLHSGPEGLSAAGGTVEPELLNAAAGLAGFAGGEGYYNPVPGVFYKELSENAAETAGMLSGISEDALGMQKSLSSFLSVQKAVIRNRLERASYYLDTDTFLIRYNLGDYYLDEGLNKEAADEYRKVVEVDPWNISAAYKLGVVEQRYGNWSEAMKFYRKVYVQDPSYENTAFYYNQLARQHPSSVDVRTVMTATPQELSVAAGASYSTEFNSSLGLRLDYLLDQQRLYRAYAGEEQGSFQVHSLQMQIPVSFQVLGLKVYPKAGFYLGSIYYSTDYAFPPDESVGLPEFLGTLSVFPRYGAGAEWRTGPFRLQGGWEYSIEPDTFYPDRDLIYRSDITLDFSSWFDLKDSELLGPFTTRTFGRMQIMSDGNLKGQILQDALIGFTFSTAPILKGFTGLTVSYENSAVKPAAGYYAPDNVLEAKVNLRASATIPSSDWIRVFEASLWGAAGGYWSALGAESAASYLKLEGGAGLTWVENGSPYSLQITGAGTFGEAGNSYWETSLIFGMGLKLPVLLAP